MKMKKFALRGLMILAVVVALCIFFSGTVRTLTTPKIRFAQAKTGKMEMETQLTGKVLFPEEEEIRVSVPEGMTLTVTRVAAAAGARVKAGDPLVYARVTDGEKTLENLQKETDTALRELRTLEKKTADIRLNRWELKWQDAWEREAAARARAQEARVNLSAALRQAGVSLEEGQLPEDAGEELKQLSDIKTKAEEDLKQASGELEELSRFAIPEETWTVLQQKKEQEKKTAELEERMTELQVLMKTAEQISAPHTGYVTAVSVEKGSSVDGDTVIVKMTREGTEPAIRFDLSEVKQEVRPGTTVLLESESWDRPSVKVVHIGLTLEGHPYADTEITQDAVYALGSIPEMMKKEMKARLVTRSQEATCLVPAAAVRGSGNSRYVYVGENESSAFGGSRMVARKMDVTVLAESGSTVSVAEDLTYLKVLYMEDRALTEGGAVMEYVKDSGK